MAFIYPETSCSFPSFVFASRYRRKRKGRTEHELMKMPKRWVAHEIHGIGEKGFHSIICYAVLTTRGPKCYFQWDSQRL